jgi:thiol-disulfide isomerase/thioredoxin
MRKLILALPVLLAVCNSGYAQTAWTPDPHGAPAGISWYPGDLTEALSAAQQRHRPVFVYFGAVWCPPCQDLKATVFKRKDVLDRLQLFVPVYIDGDSPDAQRWMQQLHAIAYPTVLILSSEGSEIDRVMGGMNLDRYASVLDVGLKATRPLKQILASLQTSGSLTLDDCRILAYNNWNLEEAWLSHGGDPKWLDQTADLLQRASDSCPSQARLERARLQMISVYAAASFDADNLKKGLPVKARLTSGLQRARSVIEDIQVSQELGDVLTYIPPEFLLAINKVDPTRAPELRERLVKLMDALQADGRYSQSVHLFAVQQTIVLMKDGDSRGAVPAQVAQSARQKAEAAIASAPQAQDRAAVMNAAMFILLELGDKERLNAVLRHEIQVSPTPYYYMGELADLEEEQGHKKAAVEWLARAYHESQGPATRVQWGSEYIKGLIRLAPEDEPEIAATAIEVLSQAREHDVLYGRSLQKMQAAARKVHEWNTANKHRAAVAEIHRTLDASCRRSSPSNGSAVACKEVLSEI